MAPADSFASALELTPLDPMPEVGRAAFAAQTPSEGVTRLFGGRVLAQALLAASRTVAGDRRVHSLHAYFLRAGRGGPPLTLEVDVTRDGRSFSSRTVAASQEGDTILTLMASFHGDEPGEDWTRVQAPDVPGPDELPPPDGALHGTANLLPFEMRPVAEAARAGTPPFHPLWVRVRERLPDDPVLHSCALAGISDVWAATGSRPPTLPTPEILGTSLDHSVWFHRPARADEWLLFALDPTTSSGARALGHGNLFARDGALVASVAQQSLLRATGRRGGSRPFPSSPRGR